MNGVVVAVSTSPHHSFAKENRESIRLLEGLGVEGDAHCGKAVQHLSRTKATPEAPNLRQVHLIHSELFDEVRTKGYEVGPGDIGENLTTRGIDLLALPTGTRLHLGETAVVEVTGLRTPCSQIDRFQPGLMAEMLDRDPEGNLIRKAGIMGIVVAGGEIRPGDAIVAELPPEPHLALGPV